MLVQKKIGNTNNYSISNKTIDLLELQWYETNKRIQRKRTKNGTEITIKFLQENPKLTQGDILFEDDATLIIVEILPCDCLVITPKDWFETASICYEIGNKHLPLFFENDFLLVPFEQPLYKLFLAQGYQVKQDLRKLVTPLNTTVAPHSSNNDTLFSKIMKLTTPNE